MLKGVGEDMPTELEMALPGYEEYPKGYTIGPVDSLKSSSRSQRVEYILSHMEQFKRLGWVTTSARGWYQAKLNDVDVATLMRHLQKDLDSEQITSEVFDMMRTLLTL